MSSRSFLTLALLLAVAPLGAQEEQEGVPPLTIEQPSSSPAPAPASEPGTEAPEATIPEAGAPEPTQADPIEPSAPAPSQPASDLGELFVRANDRYEASAYREAIELYRRVIEGGAPTGDLHFNLGNAYLRNGELGRAIASYLRSQALDPRDQDVEANLAFARKSTRDAVEPPTPAPALETLFFWHYSLSTSEKIRLAVILGALFWTLLSIRLWRRRSELLRLATWASLTVLVLVAGSLLWRLLAPERVAVVVPPEVTGLAAPAADSLALFSLHSGTEIEVTESRPEWLRIRLPDGRSAWLPRDQAELVER